eukprot:CAMPEP_0179334146 /NCGR_PEP_ID=MMETSP0797-20121207/65776_1 /TAXON_ID=47934 /ORGANISM="Dinophysis acuminata, Strain DAEP01" /LENGTH=56 /DNA_ID=CAMNT_0021047391 /DNA_START=364 /DNA_END=530 /DNA_ORIENTATION=+
MRMVHGVVGALGFQADPPMLVEAEVAPVEVVAGVHVEARLRRETLHGPARGGLLQA